MNPLQLPACAFGIHRRRRKSVWHDGGRFRSVCSGCGKPMVRNFDGWHINRKLEDDPRP